MTRRNSAVMTIGFLLILSGCNASGPYNAFNVGGSRILPPATGTAQSTQVAANPSYYDRTPTSGVHLPLGNQQPGWNPIGSGVAPQPAAPGSPASFLPANYPQPTPALAGTGASGLGLTALQSGLPIAGTPPTPTPADGRLPLNDATAGWNQTQMAANLPGGQGILNRTWEYAISPSAAQYAITGPPPAPNLGPQHVVLASSTTGAGPNTALSPSSSTGWRQREPNQGTSRY